MLFDFFENKGRLMRMIEWELEKSMILQIMFINMILRRRSSNLLSLILDQYKWAKLTHKVFQLKSLRLLVPPHHTMFSWHTIVFHSYTIVSMSTHPHSPFLFQITQIEQSFLSIILTICLIYRDLFKNQVFVLRVSHL